MQSGDIQIPLQIDLMIISADNNDRKIDNISERFNIHNQKFETVLFNRFNSTKIRKCSIKMKKRNIGLSLLWIEEADMNILKIKIMIVYMDITH